MRDTAPLAPPHAAPHGPPCAPPYVPAGRARPPFIHRVWSAPRTTTQPAHSRAKFWPRRDATLPADRQMTQRAGVAPSLAARTVAHAFPRARKGDKAPQPGMHLRSVIPGGKTKFFPGGKAFPGEAGNVFPTQGRLSPGDRSDRVLLRCRSTSRTPTGGVADGGLRPRGPFCTRSTYR
jgi:hypothetical protein